MVPSNCTLILKCLLEIGRHCRELLIDRLALFVIYPMMKAVHDYIPYIRTCMLVGKKMEHILFPELFRHQSVTRIAPDNMVISLFNGGTIITIRIDVCLEFVQPPVCR